MDTPLLTLHRQPNYRLISWSIERLVKLVVSRCFWFWKIENRHVKTGTHQKKKGQKKKQKWKKILYKNNNKNNNKNQRLLAVKTNGSPQQEWGEIVCLWENLTQKSQNTKIYKPQSLFRPRHNFLKVYGSLSKILTPLTFNWILSNLWSAIKDFNHEGH